MPITFFKDCAKYYRRNDEHISGLGRLFGGVAGGIAGTLYGASLGKLLEFLDVDRNKQSFLITYIASSAGFVLGAIAFRNLTKPVSIILAGLEASYDRIVGLLDRLLKFKTPYDKCNALLEDNAAFLLEQETALSKLTDDMLSVIPALEGYGNHVNGLPENKISFPHLKKSLLDKKTELENRATKNNKPGISNKFILQMLSAGIGAGIGPVLFSRVGQFVAPDLVFSTNSNGQSMTPESLGHEYGHILGAMLGLIMVTPIHKTLSFSGSFTFSVLKTLFWNPVVYLRDRYCPEDDDETNLIKGPINGENGNNHYIPPLLQNVSNDSSALAKLKAEKKKLKKQIKQLERKENGKTKPQQPSESPDLLTGPRIV